MKSFTLKVVHIMENFQIFIKKRNPIVKCASEKECLFKPIKISCLLNKFSNDEYNHQC